LATIIVDKKKRHIQRKILALASGFPMCGYFLMVTW
jgi:hypothetical protein